MKKIIFAALMTASVGAMAQIANNSSTSGASTQATGNNQAVTFQSTSPSDITTRATLDSTQNINSSGTTTGIIDYRGNYTVKNVPSVSGPNLTTSNDTCMGSSSGSANGPGIGISFGTTWTDEQCKRLKMSRELWNKGMKAASLAMDCMDPAAMAALEITGTRCPQSMTAQERVAAFGPNASGTGAPLASLAPSASAPATLTATDAQAISHALALTVSETATAPPPGALLATRQQ